MSESAHNAAQARESLIGLGVSPRLVAAFSDDAILAWERRAAEILNAPFDGPKPESAP